MRVGSKRVLVCDCEKSLSISSENLAQALGADEAPFINTQLCRSQIEHFTKALGEQVPLLVCCTQEAPLFREVAAEYAPDAEPTFVNIRERAGWGEDGKQAGAKIAALIAANAVDLPATPEVSMESEGVCLVYGSDEAAIAAGRQLAGQLDVTVLLSEPGDIVPPAVMDVPIYRGSVSRASGHLGAFEVTVNDYAPAQVSARGGLAFEAPRDGAVSQCDLILDLTGGAPMFPGQDRRDGYFRPDPSDPAAIQRALFELSDLVGEFSKPRYVTFDANICAHSRSAKIGCSRCLDACPISAITPNGDAVAIDPYICGGCGACNSVCPTGAANYAFPPADALHERLRALLRGYAKAGGTEPVLLIHDSEHGAGLLDMIARYGRGLAANVLPFPVNEATQVGLDLLLTALAHGAVRIVIAAPPSRQGEFDGLAQQFGIIEAVTSGLGHGGGRLELAIEDDPDALDSILRRAVDASAVKPKYFATAGTKRERLSLALAALHDDAPTPVDQVALPTGAPFGAVEVDTDGCTLCLACVGACPTGALLDNPDTPQLSFLEQACIQCGLCSETCPESVISLAPRIDFTNAGKSPRVLKEEEPYECIRCGKPFGTKSSIEKIVSILAEKHSMYADESASERLKMCEDCRVIVQFESKDNPLGGTARPIPRTTDDYLREREAGEDSDGDA
ncbi:MAG: 4Fe-4S binding protein [Rhodospirillaceae bacterium]|nr:4Fe-4S binding protein [Rhodospirillaceae bacterium]